MSANIFMNIMYDIFFAKVPSEDFHDYPDLPLLGTVFPVLLIDLAYLAFVLKIGPCLMKNRKPFQLKNIMMIYNATQVIVCAGVALVSLYYLIFTDIYDFGCLLKLPRNHSVKPTEVATVYIAYAIKYLDYLDTIFFVLRKSYRQLTFLHVYHHLIISFATYIYIRHNGFGGHGLVAGFMNEFVHVIMYSYYFAAAQNAELKKSVWWKRHLTELQIIQFVIILVHQLWPVLVRTECKFPKIWHFIICAQSIWFIYLFGKFYVKTYLRKTTSTSMKIVENGHEFNDVSKKET